MGGVERELSEAAQTVVFSRKHDNMSARSGSRAMQTKKCDIVCSHQRAKLPSSLTCAVDFQREMLRYHNDIVDQSLWINCRVWLSV